MKAGHTFCGSGLLAATSGGARSSVSPNRGLEAAPTGEVGKDLALFRRNAAIALGNTGDTSSVAALSAALSDPAQVVRAHTAWALGRIGGHRARRALDLSLAKEVGEHARREIQDALSHMP